MGSFVEFVNDCGKTFIDSTGLMLIQSSVLIAIMFGLDFLLRKRIRAVFRYCLWMLVLIKLVLPGSLSMPFSMGYWLGNAFDRVESSLPDVANPPHTPIQFVIKSSLKSNEIGIDNPARQIPATTKDAGTLSVANQLQGTYSTEAPTTNDYVGASVAKTEPTTDNIVVPPPEQVDLARDRAVALTWQAVLFGLWLVVCMGSGLLVLQKTLLLKRFVRQAHPANKHLVELFECCRKRMLIGRDVGLRVSPIISTPAVYGLFQPIVLIPKHMICHDLGTKELEAIFIHELVHIQRCDLWVKLLQTILQVVYFYNPLLWWANATIRRVRELAVDEAVLVILGKSADEVYPRTLLKVAGRVFDQPMHGLRLIGVMESNDLLTERINVMLHKPIPHSKKIGKIGLGILFILGVFLLPMARAGIQKAPAEIAQSNAEKAKEAAEIEAIKARIESLQLTIQMKLDELHEKEAELELMRQALNAKIHAHGQAETAPYSPGVVMAAVAPSDAGSYQAPPLNKQPRGGMMGAALAMPGQPVVGPPDGTGRATRTLVPARSVGMGAALAMPGQPVVGPPDGTGRATRTPVPPRGAGMVAALAMPREPVVEQSSVLGEGALPENISNEVRKELQRILPGLLRELLPKLLKEAQIKAVESPSGTEVSY